MGEFDPLKGFDPTALAAAQAEQQKMSARMKLLEFLQGQDNADRSAKSSVLGDVLKQQTDRKAMMADSFAPGTQYAPGWEPGGTMDAFATYIKRKGGGQIDTEDAMRNINAQELDDMGSTLADALAITKTILADDGEDNPLKRSLLESLTKSLMPPEETAAVGATPGGTGGLAQPFQADARDRGGASGAAAAGDVPFAADQDNPRTKSSKALTSSGGAASQVLEALGGLMDSVGVANPLAGIGPSLMTGGGPSKGGTSAGGSYAENTSGNMNADATAALVAQILQRARGQPASNAGKNKKDWGANTPGSKHPMGYKEGSPVFEGPTMIRVGERSPKDKKYATEEVVYAAPGTVVAPVPKGMENPSEEDAVGLVIAQLLKTQKTTAPGNGMQDSKVGSVTSSASQGRAAAQAGRQNFASLLSGDHNAHQERLLKQQQMFINRDQTSRGLDINARRNDQDYDLGLRGLGLRRYEADQANSLGRSRLSLDRELGQGNLQLGRDTLNMNFQKMQEEFRNWEAERALKRELGMRGLDIDKQRADQDHQINTAQMAFQQIMAGITGSALPGVRAGRTPQLSLLG